MMVSEPPRCAVGVAGVEQRHAEVERLVDHRARTLAIDIAAEIVAAEANHGDA